MSLFGIKLKKFGIFGKKKTSKKKEKAQDVSETIQKLRSMEELLIKKQEFLESKMQKEMELAKKHVQTKNKFAAKQALKRKKRYESQLQQTDGTLSTIEMQREALEGAKTNTVVLNTMSEAAKVLKAAHQHLDVDDVHDMMDDIEEEQEISLEISQAISSPINGFGQYMDDEEFERELQQLEQDELDKCMINIGAGTVEDPSGATDVPQPNKPIMATTGETKPEETLPRSSATAAEEDEDMKKLAAWSS